MHRKKRWIFAPRILHSGQKIFILFILLVPFLFVSSSESEPSTNPDQNGVKSDLFVFPSMQMESLSASNMEHVPVVEVVYRGQPLDDGKITSTTISSSEVITQTATSAPKGKFCLIIRGWELLEGGNY